MQDEFFLLKFGIQGLLKFVYEVPKQITLNRTMHSQTKSCASTSSWLDKTENGAWLKLTDTVFFFLGFVPIMDIAEGNCVYVGSP
jgi:hypothetical protein